MHEGAQASRGPQAGPAVLGIPHGDGQRRRPEAHTAGVRSPCRFFFSFRPPLDLLYYNPLLWEFPLRAWVRIRASKGHRRPFWNVRCMSPCASHLGLPARSPSSLAFPCVTRAFFMRKIDTDIVFANGKMAPSSGAIPVAHLAPAKAPSHVSRCWPGARARFPTRVAVPNRHPALHLHLHLRPRAVPHCKRGRR